MKKDGSATQSTVAFSSSGGLNSDASSLSQKYNGLVRRSPYKRMRSNLIQTANYIYTVAPHFQVMHAIVTFFRIFQLAGACLMESSVIWATDSTSVGTVSIVSIFEHLVPASNREEGSIPFVYAHFALSVVFLVIIFGSSYYFVKNAKLPSFLSSLIVIWFGAFNFVLHPIGLTLAFEYLAKVIFVDGYDYNIINAVLLPVLELFVFLVYAWLYSTVIVQTLIFRPTSLMTVMIPPAIYLYISTNVLSLLFGFAAQADKWVRMGICIVSAFIYGFTAYLPFYLGGFVNQTLGACIFAAAASGGMMCIVFCVIVITQVRIGLPLLFALVVLFILLSLMMKIIMMRLTLRNLIALDRYLEQNTMDLFNSPNKLINIIVDGMSIAHPCCINWDIFKNAMDKWPTNTKMWFLFAKFCSIYPEDTTTIAWIYHSIMATKLRGSTARTIKEQALSITRQRESNLSPSLKLKINQAQKQVTSTKHKLRHVWDLAIQGNIGEMEAAIKRFYKELEKNDAEFKHLFRQYPNNRFVTRSYARFCKELKADHAEYVESLEKSKNLQRGINVNEDMTHTLGLLAYPHLPQHINIKVDMTTTSTDLKESSFDITDNEDNDIVTDDTAANNLRENIEHLRIPAILCVKITRILMIIFVFVVPMVALFLSSSYFITNLVKPLIYISDISWLNMLSMMLTAFNTHYYYEKMNVFNPTMNQSHKPETLGGVYDTRSILLNILQQVTVSSQEMFRFRSFSSTNDNIQKAQDAVFGSSVNYVYFTDLTTNTSQLQSLQTSLMDEVAQSSSMLKETTVLPEFVNSSYILNAIQNNLPISNCFIDGLQYLLNFFNDNNASTLKYTQIGMIAGIIFVVVIFLIALIIQLVWIQSTKEEAYHCLTSLPKNAVSTLVENLRVLKNEDGNDSTTNSDTEVSKQEDNIMKILVTGGDANSSKLADRILLIIGSVAIAILESVAIYLFMYLYQYESNRLISNAPHLNYLTAVFGQLLTSVFGLQILATRFENSPYRTHIIDTQTYKDRFFLRLDTYRNFYHKARFGSEGTDETPFMAFNENLEKSDQYMVCEHPEMLPSDFMDMAACYDAESIMNLIDAFLVTTFLKATQSNEANFVLTGKEPFLDWSWTLCISPLYDTLFAPMFDTIIPTISRELSVKKNELYPACIALLLVGIIFEIIAFLQVLSIEKHIRSVLYLLLHCPQMIVMSTSKITMVLHGDFSMMKGDMTKRTSEFYGSVFSLLPDAVLICDPVTYVISAASQSCQRIINKSPEELVGENAKSILNTGPFNCDVSDLFKNASNSSGASATVEVAIKDKEGSQMHLEISTVRVSGQVIIVIRDITGTVRYNMLIADERKKSDALLQSILPPSLVKRVQAGEKNISFAVQSATIVFMDIVSFTPWCGSNEATKVMMTLNLLFKKFDAACNSYPTMTKIKCIGDCYMAAGGIFSEINNPSEHAREVVSFGLDALECVKELDQELDERLQIRVGINTGGPIVAGVLGIGKPTFEILGPAINMAQQMEHHGIPMNVHITRAVYELIYGENFKIKERGQVEVKNGSVITYLVEDRT